MNNFINGLVLYYVMSRRNKICAFSESLGRKYVGAVPLTMTKRPVVRYLEMYRK